MALGGGGARDQGQGLASQRRSSLGNFGMARGAPRGKEILGSPVPRSRRDDGKTEAVWRGSQRALVECETVRLLVLLSV